MCPKKTARFVASFAIVLALVGGACFDTHAQSAKSSLEDPAQAALFNSISNRLICQCGCNMVLKTCNHFECPSAVPMRKSIEEQILAGVSDTQIIAGFVDEYGTVAMSTPPASGINLAAWVMPGFFALLAIFLLAYFLSDLLAKKRIKKPSEPVAIDSQVALRIEEELKQIDH